MMAKEIETHKKKVKEFTKDLDLLGEKVIPFETLK
jgi:hypothetical protein